MCAVGVGVVSLFSFADPSRIRVVCFSKGPVGRAFVVKWRMRLWLPLYLVANAIMDAESEKSVVASACLDPSSSRTLRNQMISWAASVAAFTSDSVDDSETVCWTFDLQ